MTLGDGVVPRIAPQGHVTNCNFSDGLRGYLEWAAGWTSAVFCTFQVETVERDGYLMVYGLGKERRHSPKTKTRSNEVVTSIDTNRIPPFFASSLRALSQLAHEYCRKDRPFPVQLQGISIEKAFRGRHYCVTCHDRTEDSL